MTTLTSASMLLGADAPAGGTATEEVVVATIVAFAAIAAVVVIGIGHRRHGWLRPLADSVERTTGLPAWSAIPVAIVGASLLVAVWGYYWDVSWHIDRGRDPGAFANPAHWFIIVGLDGIAFGGILALILGDDRSPSAVRLTERWSVPVGAIMLSACGVVALAGFPLDDIWHRLFGQDVTAWGPTHIQLIGGASLSTLACWALVVEGKRVARGNLRTWGKALTRVSDVGFAGALLIGLSTLQVEFDFGVPQFRAVFHPVLIALGSSIALVTARIRLGRGGALTAVAFFWVARSLITFGIVAAGRSTQHIPLYLAEALLVEAVATMVHRDRQITLGAVSGALIGTIGMASEWAWSHVWMPQGWNTEILPDAAVLSLVAGTCGGVIGGFIGRALAPAGAEHQPSPRLVPTFAWVGAVGALLVCLPITEASGWSADVRLARTGTDAETGEPLMRVEAELTPAADRAARQASWFEVISWQGAGDGGPGGFDRATFERSSDGAWHSEGSVPVGGSFKTLLRLHEGTDMQAVPVAMPADAAIDAERVPPQDGVRSFVREKSVLQREAKTDNVALERTAYAFIAAIAAGWIVILGWGLRRLDPTPRAARGGALAGSPRDGLGVPA